MSTERQVGTDARQAATAAASVAQQGARPLEEFTKKWYNDWSFHLAQALAFSLITAMVPIAILLLALVGWFLNGLNHQAYMQLIDHLAHALPGQFASRDVLASAGQKLASASGVLALIAILTAIFFGSRLFTLMESCFDIIYQRQPRPFTKKNEMAIGMLLASVILIPFLVLAATIPGQALAFLQNTAINPNPDATSQLLGFLSSFIVSLLLFEAMYVFVPNRHGSLRNRIRTGWLGALAAAITLQICLALFPFYLRTFMNGYVGQLGFALVLLGFFYLMAAVLLFGAQINAFFGEHKQPPARDLVSRASQGN